MKTSIIAVFCSVWSLVSLAQVRVVPFSDTTKLGIQMDKLDAQYHPKQQQFPIREFKTLAEKQEITIGRITKSHKYSAELFYEKVGRYFSRNKSGFHCLLNSFTNKEGKLDLVLYQIETPDVSDSLQRAFVEKLQQYANSYADSNRVMGVTHSYERVGIIMSERQFVKADSMLTTVEQAQQTTRPDTVKTLAFNGLGLDGVPNEIYRFPNLEELYLNQNEIQVASIDVARLPKLRSLNLSGNQLTDGSVQFTKNKTLRLLLLQGNLFTTIPAAVRANKGLTSLWLGGNKLSNLTNGAFKKLKSLQDINFYQCGIKTLPRGVAKLKNLEVIDLYYNQLTTLPNSIKRLKRLQQLAVSYNELQMLPKKIGKLRNLHTFYVHHNRLAKLPEGLQNLKNIKLLDLNNNWLSEFPMVLTKLQPLQDLDISGNNLTELPTEIIQLRQLQKIFVSGNPFSKDDQLMSRNRPILKTLETNKTEVFY